MVRSSIRPLHGLALACLAALAPFAFAQEAPAPADAPVPARTAEEQGNIKAFFGPLGQPIEVRAVAADVHAASEYWIGVQLEPLPELITSQMKLERGMVVVQVFEDSPAAKAGLKVNDLILRAGGKDVKGPHDLVAAVNDAQEQELAIVVLRGGSETTLKVTPAKRQSEQIELRISAETPHATVVKALDELSKKTPHGAVRLLAVRPGGVFAYAAAGAALPKNLEVRIEKRGDEPAKVHVRRIHEGNDQTWDVTEDKLEELPEDIRGHVQQMLGGGRVQFRMPQVLSLPAEANSEAQRAHAEAQRALADAQRAQQRMLREYHLKVQPQHRNPAVQGPIAPPQPDQGIGAKLDAILKKLDQNQGDALQKVQKQVEELRREVDALRQDKK